MLSHVAIMNLNLLFKMFQPVFYQQHLCLAWIIVACRHHTSMGIFLAKRALSGIISADGTAMIGLAEVCETWSESKRQNFGFWICFGGQDPFQFNKVIHINPREVMVWYSKFGHVNTWNHVLVGREYVIGCPFQVFSRGSGNVGCHCSKIRVDKIELSTIDIHRAGAHLLRFCS